MPVRQMPTPPGSPNSRPRVVGVARHGGEAVVGEAVAVVVQAVALLRLRQDLADDVPRAGGAGLDPVVALPRRRASRRAVVVALGEPLVGLPVAVVVEVVANLGHRRLLADALGGPDVRHAGGAGHGRAHLHAAVADADALRPGRAVVAAARDALVGEAVAVVVLAVAGLVGGRRARGGARRW